MLDLKTFIYTPINKEIFVDFDLKYYMCYIIDHINKRIIPYKCKYAPDVVDLILEKIKQFDIDRVGLYGTSGHMLTVYCELQAKNVNVLDRTDIYQFRMTLDLSTRRRTNPIQYYELLDYKYILESDYND